MITTMNSYIKRFRQWQLEPTEYKPLDDETHQCLNCKQEFVGNFCPRCAQSSKTKPTLDLKTLVKSIRDAFNLDKSPLLRTFWQLLWRPGYLIRDYLDGKRQCSPPLTTFLKTLLVYIMVRTLLGADIDVPKPSMWMSVEGQMFLDIVKEWAREHYEWYNMLVFIFPVFTQWLLFRHSPRHSRHTLVEGFYIQVFILMLIVLIDTIVIAIGSDSFSKWTTLLWPIYYTIAIGPIFGYNWWSTLWRSIVVIYTSTRLFIMACYLVGLVLGYTYTTQFWIRQAQLYLLPVCLLVGGYFIGKYTERKRGRVTEDVHEDSN